MTKWPAGAASVVKQYLFKFSFYINQLVKLRFDFNIDAISPRQSSQTNPDNGQVPDVVRSNLALVK